jgi:hypothetical protein
VQWHVEDVTSLATIQGTFDLILDCGSLADFSWEKRTLAYQAMEPMMHAKTRLFIWGFEWPPVFYELWLFPEGRMSFDRDEVETRFSDRFDIEVVEKKAGGPFVGFGCYLLTPRQP